MMALNITRVCPDTSGPATLITTIGQALGLLATPESFLGQVGLLHQRGNQWDFALKEQIC